MKIYDKKIVGTQIQKYRAMVNLSQKDLAEFVGVSPSYISSLENGKGSINSSVSMDIISKISEILGVSYDDLAGSNIEYPKIKVEDLTSKIEKELYSMSETDLILLDKIILTLINSREKRLNK